MRGRKWKSKSLLKQMDKGLEHMKQLLYRLYPLHKWKMSKKTSFLNLFCALFPLCLRQAYQMQIPTFSKILRVLSTHYDMNESSGNLTSQGPDDSNEELKKEHAVIKCVELVVECLSPPIASLRLCKTYADEEGST